MSRNAGPFNLPSDWNSRHWRHVVLTTYGSWLHGDARGFRTRHHREHVQGDYHNPPPQGKYDKLARHSKQLLKEPPVVLSARWRAIVGTALIERLTAIEVYVVCAAVSGQHVHLLAKVRRGSSRLSLGKAKQHVWFVVREQGWRGKLWAKGSRAIVVRDKRHQRNIYRYILNHSKQGAWIWVHPNLR